MRLNHPAHHLQVSKIPLCKTMRRKWLGYRKTLEYLEKVKNNPGMMRKIISQ